MIRTLSDVRKIAAPLLRHYPLTRGYWLFFAAALCWDAGFGVYFFLFNLYLVDFHLNERAIGLINGALALGLVVGTLPAGILTRRIGARRLLIWSFLASPMICVLRAIFVWEAAAIALAFLAGVVMCVWMVCFLPVTASLTSEDNRVAATGLIFSVGVGATALGAAASGYLSQWVGMLGSAMGPADVKRIVLLISSGVAACGTIPLLRMQETGTQAPQPVPLRRHFALLRTSFLLRLLPCMALWNALLGAFTPFAAVYFAGQRHLSLAHVGLIFSASQIAQLMGGLLVPIVERSLGMLKGILVFQIATGILLALTAASTRPMGCVIFFCGYSAASWICSPAMYTLLMNKVADEDRASASSLIMFSNSLLTAGATSGLGILLLHLGYPAVMMGIGAIECLLAITLRWIVAEPPAAVAVSAAIHADSMD